MSTEKETRAVFNRIHRDHLKHDSTRSRLRSLTSEEFLGLGAGFFEDKICADIGCGSSVHGTINLLDLGAKRVFAMDLDDSFIEPATGELEPGYTGRYELDTGSVHALPYSDEQFDFVECNGVLHHIEDRQLAAQELFRVIKPGGLASIMVAGNGGLMHRLVFECLRDEYAENEILEQFVDSDTAQSVEWLKAQLGWLESELDGDESESAENCRQLLRALSGLVDEDLMLTIKDRVLSPINRGLTTRELEGYFETAGFRNWRRLSRQVPYNNIRKLLAPMYYHQQHEFSRLFYGDGSRLHYLVEK